MYVHQLVAEAKLGRPLRANESVEHLNGNYLDNSPDNLLVVTLAENTRLMHLRRRCRAGKARKGDDCRVFI